MNLNEAKKLAEKFVKEIEKECKAKMIWWFIGSIQTGKYVEGKSDIDIIVIPKEKGYLHPRYVFNKIEKYKKYGTVFKKGRDISLIDCLIFLDTKIPDRLREDYLKTHTLPVSSETGKGNQQKNKYIQQQK